MELNGLAALVTGANPRYRPREIEELLHGRREIAIERLGAPGR